MKEQIYSCPVQCTAGKSHWECSKKKKPDKIYPSYGRHQTLSESVNTRRRSRLLMPNKQFTKKNNSKLTNSPRSENLWAEKETKKKCFLVVPKCHDAKIFPICRGLYSSLAEMQCSSFAFFSLHFTDSLIGIPFVIHSLSIQSKPNIVVFFANAAVFLWILKRLYRYVNVWTRPPFLPLIHGRPSRTLKNTHNNIDEEPSTMVIYTFYMHTYEIYEDIYWIPREYCYILCNL